MRYNMRCNVIIYFNFISLLAITGNLRYTQPLYRNAQSGWTLAPSCPPVVGDFHGGRYKVLKVPAQLAGTFFTKVKKIIVMFHIGHERKHGQLTSF